jgi:ribosomal protein L11 methyltransferase
MPLAALVVDDMEAGDAECVSDALLSTGALSVELGDAASGTPSEQALYDEPGERGMWRRIKLTALFHAASDPVRSLHQACDACGVSAPPHDVHSVDDDDWVTRSHAQFQPIRVSSRLWVVPSWHRPPDADAINLILDPGMAFGTGSHPSTRLCLLWLVANVRGGEALVDYGCGSGILTIAAMKLGASRALGVDIDAHAVATAQLNARRNGVSARFFDANAAPDLSGDLVVANILANPLKMLAPVLAGICTPGGRLALAGILVPQESEILDAYRPWFELDGRAEADGWLCLSGARR